MEPWQRTKAIDEDLILGCQPRERRQVELPSRRSGSRPADALDDEIAPGGESGEGLPVLSGHNNDNSYGRSD
jgi:hypothetical protein